MLKLDGIASFVAIAESRSISGAARRLHLSKSVVSERLTELENQLGAPLFHLPSGARPAQPWAEQVPPLHLRVQ